MRVVIDWRIPVYVLPECARCTVTGMHPDEFNECPESSLTERDTDECDPDCPYYTEDW